MSLSFKESFCGCDATLVMFDDQKFNFYVWGDWISNFIWNISDNRLTLPQTIQDMAIFTKLVLSKISSYFSLSASIWPRSLFLLDYALDISLKIKFHTYNNALKSIFFRTADMPERGSKRVSASTGKIFETERMLDIFCITRLKLRYI